MKRITNKVFRFLSLACTILSIFVFGGTASAVALDIITNPVEELRIVSDTIHYLVLRQSFILDLEAEGLPFVNKGLKLHNVFRPAVYHAVVAVNKGDDV